MNDTMKEAHDRFNSEFIQFFSKMNSQENWPKDCIETMKNLLKCVYYIEVLDAMHGEGSPDYDNGMSGRYSYPSRSYGNRSYGPRNGMSGTRYYDDGKEHAIRDLRMKMDSEQNPEIRMAYQKALNELEMR